MAAECLTGNAHAPAGGRGRDGHEHEPQPGKAHAEDPTLMKADPPPENAETAKTTVDPELVQTAGPARLSDPLLAAVRGIVGGLPGDGPRAVRLGLERRISGVWDVAGSEAFTKEQAALLNKTIRQAAARIPAEGFHWTTLQVNIDTVSGWHKDADGEPPRIVVVCGDFRGGQLRIEGEGAYDVTNAGLMFDGRRPHKTETYEGPRVSLVAYRLLGLPSVPPDVLERLIAYGFPRALRDQVAPPTSDEDEDGWRRPTLHEVTGNWGPPLEVKWGGKTGQFHDGAGLCSPGRWLPSARPAVTQGTTAEAIVRLLRLTVRELGDPSREVFRLATGKAKASPFAPEQIIDTRLALARLMKLPEEAADERARYQPFRLRLAEALAQQFRDPDWKQLVQAKHSFASGVPIGVGVRMPRVPAVYERKTKWRAIDETEFQRDKDNYRSAEAVLPQLESQFLEEERQERMFQEDEEELRKRYPGELLRVAALGAIEKGDASFRVVHDGTHGVRLNNEATVRDRIRMPGPREERVVMRLSAERGGVHFALCADVRHAHRCVVNREADWGLQACRVRRPMLWVNRVGTFGVGTACYWWSRLAGTMGRIAIATSQQEWLWQLIFADDLKWTAHGPHKFENILLMILVWEIVGTPIAWNKCKGGSHWTGLATGWITAVSRSGSRRPGPNGSLIGWLRRLPGGRLSFGTWPKAWAGWPSRQGSWSGTGRSSHPSTPGLRQRPVGPTSRIPRSSRWRWSTFWKGSALGGGPPRAEPRRQENSAATGRTRRRRGPWSGSGGGSRKRPAPSPRTRDGFLLPSSPKRPPGSSPRDNRIAPSRHSSSWARWPA